MGGEVQIKASLKHDLWPNSGPQVPLLKIGCSNYYQQVVMRINKIRNMKFLILSLSFSKCSITTVAAIKDNNNINVTIT